MKLVNTKPFNTRRGRRALNRARNPREVSRHACDRFIEDCARDRSISVAVTRESAERHIRQLCARATKIHRGTDCRILTSGEWWIFYRDEIVLTIMHTHSRRRRIA